jgi:PAS domain S-box-containing protein
MLEFAFGEDLQSMADAAPVMLRFSGPEADCTFCNKAWLEFRCRSREQELSRAWIEGMHANDRLRYLDIYRTAFNDQRPFETEYRLLRADGALRNMLEKGSPWIAPDGSFRGYVNSAREITDAEIRLRANPETPEWATLEEQNQFRLLVESVQDYAIFVLDPVGIILSWNPGAERIKGYEAQEVIGKHFSCFYTAEDCQRGKPDLGLKTSAAKGRFEDEGWRLRKDGSKIWASVVITALRDKTGRLLGFGKVTRDLTERKNAEDALRKSHAELESRVRDRTAELAKLNDDLQRSLTEQIQVHESLRLRDRAIQAVSQGILISDANQLDMPVIYASPGFERLTGYRADEIVGRNCRLLQGKDTDPETLRKLRNSISAGRECSVEILNYRKDGTSFWNALFVTPVRDGRGKIINFIGVQADVTERRRLEDQLRQAQKMEAFGQLAGGVAHDFNNLLSVICGYSEILLSILPFDDPNRASVLAIGEAGERAASLTRQLLSFSRKTVLEPRVVDLNSVVQSTEKLLRRTIGDDVVLKSILDPQIKPTKVDPHQIGQVLINLAVNSRDAMPRGGKLTIETRKLELDDAYVNTHIEVAPGRYVLLTISDTGIGMTPEVRSRIFEPFFTTKDVGHGTGLGLSVVHGIVKQSSGQIAAYSELGVGTVMKIYLPAVDEEISSPVQAHAESPGLAVETVLLVEDDEAVRQLALLTLETQGYRVLAAANGKEALTFGADASEIDILVTDVVMPEMSGRELAEILQPWCPKMKVLYLSGYTEDAVLRHGILKAEVAFMQKPYTPTGLLKKIRQVLDGKGSS